MKPLSDTVEEGLKAKGIDYMSRPLPWCQQIQFGVKANSGGIWFEYFVLNEENALYIRSHVDLRAKKEKYPEACQYASRINCKMPLGCFAISRKGKIYFNCSVNLVDLEASQQLVHHYYDNIITIWDHYRAAFEELLFKNVSVDSAVKLSLPSKREVDDVVKALLEQSPETHDDSEDASPAS